MKHLFSTELAAIELMIHKEYSLFSRFVSLIGNSL